MVYKEFQIRGRVIDKVTQQGIGGLRVEVWDKDLICDDFLDQAETDGEGSFSLSFSTSSFSKPDPGDLFDFLDVKPDVYFKVYEGKQVLETTDVMPNIEEQKTEVTIEVSRDSGDEVEKERSQFKALLLANPNYFGTIPESSFEAVCPKQGNTDYEEIGCVGFQPQLDQLEAVVYIKRPNGYGGPICSSLGTPEYVRFYLSYDDGATWEDQGVASFTAYDIPDVGTKVKRLEYAVILNIDPKKKLCCEDHLILARAILSWNSVPPPATPNHVPIWGNVHDTHIQTEKAELPSLKQVFEVAKLELPEELVSIVDLNQEVKTLAPKKLSLKELHELYQGKVEPKRYLQTEVEHLLSQPLDELATGELQETLADLEINLPDIVEQLSVGDGDTRYEELECVGLDPTQDELVGIIRVKLPSGYLGKICRSKGSKEYVAFYEDFDNNGIFKPLGVASVNVYDFSDIPEEGLEYAVSLPVNLNEYRQPCKPGAKPTLGRIRAILSWEQIPTGPNFIPRWGNREETIIHVYPGQPVEEGVFTPFLDSVSHVAVCAIDQTTGLTKGLDRPFGATLYIRGEIPAAMILTTPNTLKYKVSVRPLNALGTAIGTWQTLTNTFYIWVREGNGFTATSKKIKQEVDGEYYTYREYGVPYGTLPDGTLIPQDYRRVISPARLLAAWRTTSSETGLWEIKVEALDTITGLSYVAGTSVCDVTGESRQNVKVYLDQQRPEPYITITGYTREGEFHEAAVCDTFQKDDTIHGEYSVSDEHFHRLTLTVQPKKIGGVPHGATVNPPARSYPVVPTTGESGTWTLDTSPLSKCGYVVRLDTWDRTIVSGDDDGWYNFESVGFCLEEP